MQSSKIALTFLVVVLIQCTFVESGGWWWRRSRNRRTPVKTGCKYPSSDNEISGSRSEYFYGTTSLNKDRKREFSVFKWKLDHSLLMFRGKIFEWGMGDSKTYKMNRNPSQCSITWSSGSKGTSKCLLSDVEEWTRNYPKRNGEYHLLKNNCHYFVNRLVRHLNTDCGH
ncbi:Hypothetical predicted protein [Paramuricea clavata]|uniref:Uncharacterized protein n=1 Tax=Paramuricea clavata TaxID=317549 RepID=A0A6S7IME5_PARCT|nr:Hypothetical predicted protein [Paramuricea clavata]